MYRSIISHFLYAKSMSSIIQHTPYCSTWLSRLSDTDTSQRETNIPCMWFFMGSDKEKSLTIDAALRAALGVPARRNIQKAGVRVIEEVLVPSSCSQRSKNEGHISVHAGPIHYWANKVSATPPVKPKSLCLKLHHIGEKTNKHGPEFEFFFF